MISLMPAARTAAASVDIDAAEFERLLSGQQRLAPIQNLTQQAVDEFGITGTPTFFVNSDVHVGGQTFEMMSAAIEEKLKR